MTMQLQTIDLERFQTLIEINELINSDFSDLEAVLARIVESATRLTEGSASSLLLVDPDTGKLYFKVALGAKGSEVKSFSLDMGEGIAGWVAKHNRSLIVNDAAEDPRHMRDISAKIGYHASSILAVPMRKKDRCAGVIEILNKRNHKPFTEEDRQWLEIFANQAAIVLQNARAFQRVRSQIERLSDQVRGETGYHTLVWKSAAFGSQLQLVQRAAPTNSTVLILGESGVGKELVAEQIHLQSRRAKQPFVRVNCAALPAPLLESELFGHMRGAFTDAVSDRLGRFELADKGTIFLDEIGELPMQLQAKLLRVLQERTFERVGSSESIVVDVRIIAATNKDIAASVERGEFRSDLFYRLNVVPIHVPPLRERPEDIPELARYFLRRISADTQKPVHGFNEQALQMLLSYHWPGNVRELQNVVERAVVISGEVLITPADLLLPLGDRNGVQSIPAKGLKEGVALFKREFIRLALERNDWNQTAAAKELDVQRSYLSRLAKELDIHPEE